MKAARVISFATLTNRKILVPAPNGKYFAVETHYFTECHRAMVARILFDETYYLTRYPDIGEALRAGRIGSAHEHYLTQGYYEHRMPYDIRVNEDWYLEAYADVRAAVTEMLFASGQDHFERSGYREGRLPFAHFALKTDAKSA